MKRTLAVLSLSLLSAGGTVQGGALAAGAPAPTPTLTDPEKKTRYLELKKSQGVPPPGEIAAPAAAPAGLHREGDVAVTWKKDFPATLNSEAVHESKTLKVPVYGKGAGGAGCAQKFQLVSVAATYKGTGGALVDLAPKVTLSAKKLFDGRSDPPEFVIVSKANPPDRLSLDLSGGISVSQWPKKGYAFKGTFTLTKLWALMTPDKWARVEIECD
jgi:hypothetical protein